MGGGENRCVVVGDTMATVIGKCKDIACLGMYGTILFAASNCQYCKNADSQCCIYMSHSVVGVDAQS